MYLILVAVDVSDFADSDLVGVWIREKRFFGHVFVSRVCLLGTSLDGGTFFWFVLLFFEMV